MDPLNSPIGGAPNFTWAEMITTDHTRFAADQLKGLEDPKIRAATQRLAIDILQPIRDRVGRPVKINSGYRSPALNASLSGASATSQHMRGEAADIAVPGFSDADLYDLWLILAFDADKIHSGYGARIGQVIFEDRRPGREGGAWIHISLGAPFRAASRSGQRLTWDPVGGYQRWTSPPPASLRARLVGA